LLRSSRLAATLDARPAAWLVGLQADRSCGGIVLVSWSRGEISGPCALPAGTGDVLVGLVGLLAVPVARLLQAGLPAAGTVAIGWNVLGLADFALAVGIGIVSAPGPLQLIVPDAPNGRRGTFPTVMIPAFAVPSSSILPVLWLWQLTHLGSGAAAGPAPVAGATVASAR
jgi:hypothetical protein